MKPTSIALAALLTIFFSGHPVRADQFVNGQSADVVLGQPDFASIGAFNHPERFSAPHSIRRDPTTGKVFVSVSNQSRVLRYSSEAAARSGSDPEAVFGQPNFNSFNFNQGGPPSATSLNAPAHIFVDHRGRLWVADQSNRRVLCWFAASFRGSGEAADYVFGQPDFISIGGGAAANQMNTPSGVWVTPDDVLWVADTFNRRVLRFDDISAKTNGAPADGVLGQPGFGSAGAATTQTGMGLIVSVAVDEAGRLWVADTNNNRILRFDDAKNLPNGAPADAVLGQADFISSGISLSADSMDSPLDVFPDADGSLWVADFDNGRVIGFANAAALGNGAAATFVLGQPDFTTNAPASNASSLFTPTGVSSGPDGSLYVADFNYHRVLRFSPFRTPTVRFTRARAVSRRPVYTARGTSTGVVTSVRYQLGTAALRNAQGTNSWSARVRLRPGRNTLSAIAEGPGGTSATARQTVIYNATRKR